MIVRLCAKLPCVIITPFGSDVLPEVYCKKARSFLEMEDSCDEPVEDEEIVLFVVTIHCKFSGQAPPRGRFNLEIASLAPASFLA